MTSDDLNGELPAAPPQPMPSWWLIGPVVALIVAAGTVLAVTIGFAVSEIDRTAVAGSQRLADTAVRIMEREIALWAKDYAFWDAAAEKLVVAPDPEWADANVGQYVFDSFGFTATVVVDGADEVLYFAYDSTRSVPAENFAVSAVAALAPIIAAARAVPLDRPEGVSGFVDREGTVLLAGAAAIMPSSPDRANLLVNPRPVLIFIQEIDATLLGEQQQRFNLPDLRLVRDKGAASAHACPIAGPGGEPIAWLDWTPQTAGRLLIDRLFWPLVAIAIAFAALGWLVLRRLLKAHRDLHDQARALHQANEELFSNAVRVRSALQRAEHATRAKSGFLAGISHELRTPLTAIVGFSQILKLQHRPEKTRSREQEYAEIIHDSSQHLLHLVNDILDLAKIESGGYELEESWIDLRREVRAVRVLLEHDAERRGVSLETELPDRLPALRGDAKAIRQILINLLSNALKFTERGGWARLTVRPNADGGLVLEVTDNGTGIDPEDQHEIWEAFKRARNPGLAKAEGSGLGLHLVKVLATLHGAEIGLESTPGTGTRVWVAFGPERVRTVAA